MDAHAEEAPAAAGARQEMHFLSISIHMRAVPRTDEANAPVDKREAEGEAGCEVRVILRLLAHCSALVQVGMAVAVTLRLQVLLLRAPLGQRPAAIGIESLLQPLLGGPPPDANALQKLVVRPEPL